MGRAIFHIAVGIEWNNEEGSGIYEPGTLREQGFVHCSYSWQLERVANAVFAGQRGLVLLRIDPDRLRADMREEPAEPSAPPDAPVFPHIYGPIDMEAVTGVWPFEPDPDGQFRMVPEALESRTSR
jgi:uncharacterized protein (DUF952 family)